MILRSQRLELGLSQSRLSRLAGVSRFKLSQHELGGKSLTSEELERIDTAIHREAAGLIARASLSDSSQSAARPSELAT
jgi:predicted transcriptional regulator